MSGLCRQEPSRRGPSGLASGSSGAGPSGAGSTRPVSPFARPVSPFARPVSPNEWLYLASPVPLTIQLVVEGVGTIERGDLERAVAVAGDACPGSRLVRSGRTWVDSGVAPPVRSGSVPGACSGAAGVDAAAVPMETTCDVLQADGTVVFRAGHGVMDGRGALRWATEVFRALRGEVASGATSPITDYALLDALGPTARRSSIPLRSHSPLRATDHRATPPGPAAHHPAPRFGLLRVAGTAAASKVRRSGGAARAGAAGWARRTLDGNHPGLVAKIAAAIGGSRYMVPVDLRRHDPDLDSTANLSLPIFLDGRPGDGWTDWHQRLLRALADRRELVSGTSELAAFRLPLSVVRPGLAALDALSRRTDRYACDALVSHLGRVDLAAFSTPDFAATTLYSVPVHAPLAPVSIVATEPAGRTELTLSYPDAPGMADRAAALLDQICDALVPATHRGWAGPVTEPSEDTVVDLFCRQAAATPDAIALTTPTRASLTPDALDAAQDVTYAELLRRAEAVAAALAARGAGPGSVVGLLADRSVAALAGLWGVLLAGAAYLPLDPAHPDTRIATLLADAARANANHPDSGPTHAHTGHPAAPAPAAVVCLTDRRNAARVARPLVIEDVPPATTRPRTPRPDDRAYVIYTSGSTGAPKGVQITHRSLMNYVTWASRLYRVDAGTRFALFTSLAFDLTGTAIFPPLLAGGSIALVPDEVSPATLRHVLHGCGANALKLTPAHLDLIGMLDLKATGFRTLVVGGEQLTTAVAARAREALGCRIVNEYGPTEATIGCVVHVFDGDTSAPAVPIGLPVDNTRAYLLDADRRPVAPGDPGELYLAGAQLTTGYLGRADDRFPQLADGSRAYRTGDLARLLPSGVLEYLGRADDQIKIRGHRVEPGEVEAALVGHPGVVRAAVVGRARPGSRDTVLCAYVVADCPPDELRPYLAERLPAHLVPSYLRSVDALPLTANGKVDVRALPDPFAAGFPAAYLARLDPIETAVARIWSRVLSVPVAGLGPDADFHSLGGDSLTMIEMIVSVGRTVVGPDGEAAFHDTVAALVDGPTLTRVAEAARQSVPA